ncbi:YciI family protein [Georgenia faecalis]|uniref:YciI family protein n=1 Tax=Georgenia faecalis TaxID=2483799 RepID=A0ABV9DBP4_9MICO|nr:YciI family protein [Georgenia faecalis]
MTVFAVEYTYDHSRTDDIALVRPDHRAFLGELVEAGRVLASGPWLDNAAPGALLLVVGEDVAGVERMLDEDPFHRARLVTRRTVRAWDPVLGVLAQD